MSAAAPLAGIEVADERPAITRAKNPRSNRFAIAQPSQTKWKHRRGYWPPRFMIIREDRTRQSIRVKRLDREVGGRLKTGVKTLPKTPHRGLSNYHSCPARV